MEFLHLEFSAQQFIKFLTKSSQESSNCNLSKTVAKVFMKNLILGNTQITLRNTSYGNKIYESIPRSLIDLNRAGVGLMEIVFEPDLKDGEEAVALVSELIRVLQTLDTCNCKMEGELNLLS